MVSTKSCLFVALLCSSLFVTHATSDSSSQIYEECLKEFGLDPKSGQNVSDDVHFKAVACIFKKDGTVTPNGKVVSGAHLAMVKAGLSDQKEVEKVTAFVTNCENEINSTKRTVDEAAEMFADCVKKLGDYMSKKA